MMASYDAAPGYLRDRHGDAVARGAERDGAVLGERGPDARRAAGEVQGPAVGPEEAPPRALLDRQARDVCEQLVRVAVVVQRDLQRDGHRCDRSGISR